MKKLLFVLLATLGLAACSSKVGQYSVLSNSNVDITHSKNFSRGDKVNGGDTTLIFFIFPLGNPDVNTALTRAIEQDKCVVGLTDVTVTYNKAWLFSVGLNDIKVEGRQLIDTALPGCANRRL
jgi:hypothetical protein